MNTFLENLKKLTQLHSQKEVAKLAKVSTSSITNYLSGKSQPSVQFLLNLKKGYHLDLDEFLTIPIKKQQTLTKKEVVNLKFVGSFIVHYYNSSAYKGKVGSYNNNVLNFAVISVCEKSNLFESTALSCFGLFMLTRQQAEEYLQKLHEIEGDNEKITDFYHSKEKYYSGSFDYNQNQIFISLTSESDKSFIILNNPPSTKKYIGGLGTANSVSRGREKVPCIQYVLISRNKLEIPDGEIYNMLALGYSEIHIKNEINDVISTFKNTYVNKTSKQLDEYQQKKIVENAIKNVILETLDSNMFRFGKISIYEDDNYFRLIKEESND